MALRAPLPNLPGTSHPREPSPLPLSGGHPVLPPRVKGDEKPATIHLVAGPLFLYLLNCKEDFIFFKLKVKIPNTTIRLIRPVHPLFINFIQHRPYAFGKTPDVLFRPSLRQLADEWKNPLYIEITFNFTHMDKFKLHSPFASTFTKASVDLFIYYHLIIFED